MRRKTNTLVLENSMIYIYLILYGILSFLTLDIFPTIHSDETWLAGLTLEYMNSTSVFVQEPFFDLMPRTIHLMKSLYHLIQIPFITLFGYNIVSVRLLSLITSLLTLYFFYKILLTKGISPRFSFIYTLLLSLNLQFIYASHFGRQESILLLVLTVCYYLYLQGTKAYVLGLIIGLSIGFHPNAFIIALIIGLLLCRDVLYKACPLKKLLSYGFTLLVLALVYIFIIILNNPDFISQYFAYGQTLQVDAAPAHRLANFKDFYIKLYYQISGTYYIPMMKFLYITTLSLFTLNIITHLVFKSDKKHLDPVFMIIAFNLAIFIIGRFNPTSITFALLPAFLLIVSFLEYLRDLIVPKKQWLILALTALLCLFSSYYLYNSYQDVKSSDYQTYLSSIQRYIHEDSVILGNLSSGFVFENHDFYDIRNLAFLDQSKDDSISFDDELRSYILDRGINTLIYYEEYDYIHRNPEWTILYGQDNYYDPLQTIIDSYGQELYSFKDSYYGTRIIRYMNDYPWEVRIIKLDLEKMEQ